MTSVTRAAATWNVQKLASQGVDLFQFAKPGLEPAFKSVIESLAMGGSRTQALTAGTSTFLGTPAGKALGQKALGNLTPLLDQLVKRPLLAQHWGKLTQVAAKPGQITGLMSKALSVPLGAQGAKLVGKFSEKILRTATQKGFGEAIKIASKGAPALLKALGKFAKFLPGLGLATSLISAIKTFADPTKTSAQKLAALLDVAAGAVGLIPGIGTGVQLAIGAASTGVGMLADAHANATQNKGWQPG